KRPPTVAVPATGKPGAIVVQVGKSGSVVGRIRVLQRRRCGGADTVNAAGNPAVKVVLIQKPPNGQRRIATGLDRKGLALFESRRVVLVQNGNATLQRLHGAAVIVIIKSERTDRKSTRLNSSHGSISYAVFC